MEEEVQGAVETASPAVSTEQPTGTQAPAGAENTESQAGQPPEKLPPFHTHPRFQQVIRENQQLRQAVGQLAEQVQQMQTLQQKAQAQGGLSPQDKTAYQDAARALKDIIQSDPELQPLLDMLKNKDQLLGTHQTVQTLRQAQVRGLEQQGLNRISELADREQLPKDPASRGVFIKLVESMVLQLPQGKERFLAGDLTVFDEALERAKPLLAHIKREAQATTLDTKARTRQLPSPTRGSAAGPPGLPKLDPANPRAYETALHKAATEHLAQKG